jgi:hypothetical protein
VIAKWWKCLESEQKSMEGEYKEDEDDDDKNTQ